MSRRTGRPLWVAGFLILILQPTPSALADDALFARGKQLYADKNYESAAEVFEELVEDAPDVSEHHNWLGKAYGRIAEHSNWFSAVRLAKKTQWSFEQAVELDPTNVSALRDLRQYYLEAPGFLGGSEKKAGAISRRLEALTTDSMGVP